MIVSVVKLFLGLLIVFAGIYAATPLWFPYFLARQLPTGFQLEHAEINYPGVTGINIKALRVNGEALAADITLSAADVLIGYQGLRGEIDSLLLEIYVRPGAHHSQAHILDELSLPIIQITEKLPELSVNQLRLLVHLGSAEPLGLDFQSIKLEPSAEGFRLTSGVRLDGVAGISGRVEVNVVPESIVGALYLNAVDNSPAWLSLQFEQKRHALNTVTRLEVAIDTELADQEWLNSVVAQSTAGLLTRVSGKLNLRADFAGQNQQTIKQIYLSTETLQVMSDDEVLNINVDLQVSREGEKLVVVLPRPAEVKYQARTSENTRLLSDIFSGLQNEGATKRAVSLRLSDFQFEVAEISRLNSATAKGLVTVSWEEDAPFAYVSGDLNLRADALTLSTSAKFRLSNQMFNFEQVNEFGLQFKNLELMLQAEQGRLDLNTDHYAMNGSLDFNLSMSEPEPQLEFVYTGVLNLASPVIRLVDGESLPSTRIVADELLITTELSAQKGRLITTGDGSFLNGRITPLSASADRIDISWKDLDLLNMTGKLTTRTHGFAADIDGEPWSGFDFDIAYTILSNADTRGLGTIELDSGPSIPFEFEGNVQTERWDILLPITRINIKQLDSLLHIAHLYAPDSIMWAGGYVDVQGKLTLDQGITANMVLRGTGIDLSMAQSKALGINFSLDASYGNTLSVNGPLSIESLELAGDLELSQITADLDIDGVSHFGLENLKAGLFDGTLKLANLRFLQGKVQHSEVELSGIDLGRLLEFADVDGLEGTGTLQITLPFGSDRHGLYIKDARFSADGPGSLAYAQEGVMSGNIGLLALENFQYQRLSGTMNYQSDGNYQIAIHLEGKNPDLYEGYPLVFTLNISGLLPELFDALFISGNFEEAILKQIRNK